MKNFLARLTPPCRDVTRLASESMDRMLPWSTRLSLRLHYVICDACAQYRRQLRQVRQALRKMGASSGGQQKHASPLSPEAAARLKETLRAKSE